MLPALKDGKGAPPATQEVVSVVPGGRGADNTFNNAEESTTGSHSNLSTKNGGKIPKTPQLKAKSKPSKPKGKGEKGATSPLKARVAIPAATASNSKKDDEPRGPEITVPLSDPASVGGGEKEGLVQNADQDQEHQQPEEGAVAAAEEEAEDDDDEPLYTPTEGFKPKDGFGDLRAAMEECEATGSSIIVSLNDCKKMSSKVDARLAENERKIRLQKSVLMVILSTMKKRAKRIKQQQASKLDESSPWFRARKGLALWAVAKQVDKATKAIEAWEKSKQEKEQQLVQQLAT